MTTKKDKILLIGHLAKRNKKIADGQTIKTREILRMLESENYIVFTVDTYKWKMCFPKTVILLLIYSVLAKKTVFLLSNNGLKFLLPILVKIKRIFKRDLYYIVIGAWLSELVQKKH